VGARLTRRRVILIALAAVVLAAGAGIVWFQPHKLFIDQRVDEALPGAAAAATDTGPGTAGDGAASTRPADREPVTLAAGRFRSLGHETSGRAAVLEVTGGRRFLRLDDLNTSNGPDLFVYLSTTPADGPRDSFDDHFVNIGRLKANQGNQNYELDDGVALDRYRSVVIWCRRFTYAFGAAPLA
jgi:Electron transfer DM13